MLSSPGPTAVRSDAELLAAHVAGDRYAFEELFGRHHSRLYRLARRTTRSPEDAADAVQDAMLAAALQCAKEIAAKPPVAIWGTKQVIHYSRDHSVDDALKQMGWVQGAIWSNAHVREAVTAMKAKRPGEFPALSALQSFKEIGL